MKIALECALVIKIITNFIKTPSISQLNLKGLYIYEWSTGSQQRKPKPQSHEGSEAEAPHPVQPQSSSLLCLLRNTQPHVALRDWICDQNDDTQPEPSRMWFCNLNGSDRGLVLLFQNLPIVSPKRSCYSNRNGDAQSQVQLQLWMPMRVFGNLNGGNRDQRQWHFRGTWITMFRKVWHRVPEAAAGLKDTETLATFGGDLLLRLQVYTFIVQRNVPFCLVLTFSLSCFMV